MIIFESGPTGSRCLVGCSNSPGAAVNQLYYPVTLSFDSYRNMFATEQDTDRIQKFVLLTNTCGKSERIYLERIIFELLFVTLEIF